MLRIAPRPLVLVVLAALTALPSSASAADVVTAPDVVSAPDGGPGTPVAAADAGADAGATGGATGGAGAVSYERLRISPLGPDPDVVTLAQDLRLLCGEVTAATAGRLPAVTGDRPTATTRAATLRAPAGITDVAVWGDAVTGLVEACRDLDANAVGGLVRHAEAWAALRDLDPADRGVWVAAVQCALDRTAPVGGAPAATSWASIHATCARRAAAGTLQGLDQAIGWLGGPSGAIVDGLAEFLVDRAKAELTIWLEERLAALCDEDVGGLGTVAEYAPNLCEAFHGGDTPLSPLGLGKALRAAAVADLRRLPDRLLWHAYTKDAGTAGGALLLARVLYAYAGAVFDGGDALETLAGLAELPASACARPGGRAAECEEARSGLRALGAFVRCALPLLDRIRAQAEPTNAEWAAFALVAADRATAYGVPGAAILGRDAVDAWRRAQEKLRLLGDMAAVTRSLAEAFERGEVDADWTVLQWRRLVSLGQRFLGAHAGVPIPPELRRVLEVMARAGLQLVERDFAGALTTVASELVRQLDAIELPRSARTLLSLGAELATAQSSDEVAKALEAAAAPPGGYREKYRRHMVSLTGFVGVGVFGDVAVSNEPLLDGLSEDPEAAFYPVGMLGIEGSFAVHPKVHLGAFLSVLDVGALLRGRVGGAASTEGSVPADGAADPDAAADDTVRAEAEPLNDIGLSQVFAPGLFFTIGLCESPFTIGLGASYSPELRAVSLTRAQADEAYAVRTVDAVRFGLFVSIDVTILPF